MSQALLTSLAGEQRQVLSEWRALILLRRATFALPQSERRWQQLPLQEADLRPLFRQMQGRGEVAPLPKLRRLYQVTVPYARLRPLEEDEVLMEVHPFAAVSDFSALVFHGLTDELPRDLTAVAPLDGAGDLLPLDTEPRDWEGLPMVRGRTPDRILGSLVRWRQVKPERYFGLGVYQPHGYSVRVTTPERTLLDVLQHPDRSGGIGNVLRAWWLARDTLDLDRLVHYVERFDIALLRQRVGFILEELGLSHPALAAWQATAQRGGSSKLVSALPYSPEFSERWSLSLNAPLAPLHAGHG